MDDCVFNLGKKCRAVTEKQCEGCRFHKTREELLKGRKKALERIWSLPYRKREYIRLKYYRGGVPNDSN